DQNRYDKKNYNRRTSLPDKKNKEIILKFNPRQWYNNAIKDLKKFKTDIKTIREEGIAKLIKLTPGGANNDGVENLNAFLANALYNELGEDYAYYNKEKKKRFGNFEKFLNRQENRFSYDYKDYLYDVLRLKPEHPEEFGGYIDHAYFSAITLLTTLMYVVDEKELNEMYTHALTAILLHNSLYKFSITEYNEKRKNENSSVFNDGKHFNMRRNPLAWLLMLCDELQCWDRTSYGQNSRGEVHPFDCELKFNKNIITATYIFDKDMYTDKKGNLKDEYVGKKGTYNKLELLPKKGKSSFLEDIENIISINGDASFDGPNKIKLEVGRCFKQNKKYRGTYLSTSNFIHMYKFSILVHQMNHLKKYKSEKDRKIKERKFEKQFEDMSLEYKINHISRAKKFSKVLGEIGCFYSDKPMDCEIVSEFTKAELQNVMGPIEHERWCWEHFVMGWRYIAKAELSAMAEKYRERINDTFEKDYKCTLNTNTVKTIIRECIKLHQDIIEFEEEDKSNGDYYCGYNKEKGMKHFAELADAKKHDRKSQNKDKRSMGNLLKVLNQEDGIKVYRLRKK
ncbi:MAG: hypothetical protein K6E76_04870, partial [Patescibacteria group bacterium]|nr:hypothetical protein [Patescibacteria group bacterium]